MSSLRERLEAEEEAALAMFREDSRDPFGAVEREVARCDATIAALRAVADAWDKTPADPTKETP